MDLGPAAISISPAFYINLSKTSSLRMLSLRNLRYSKSLTEFFWPEVGMVVGRNPPVFQACARLSFPLSELLYRAALFFYLTPRNISLSLCIYFVKWTLPSPFLTAIYVLALTFSSSSFLSDSDSLALTSERYFNVSFAFSTHCINNLKLVLYYLHLHNY